MAVVLVHVDGRPARHLSAPGHRVQPGPPESPASAPICLDGAAVPHSRVLTLLLLAACGSGVPGPGGPDGGGTGVALEPTPGRRICRWPARRSSSSARSGPVTRSSSISSTRPTGSARCMCGRRAPPATPRRSRAGPDAADGDRLGASGTPVESLPFGPLVRPLVTAGAVTPVLASRRGLPPGAVLDVTARLQRRSSVGPTSRPSSTRRSSVSPPNSHCAATASTAG
jgi:hypothetical protein